MLGATDVDTDPVAVLAGGGTPKEIGSNVSVEMMAGVAKVMEQAPAVAEVSLSRGTSIGLAPRKASRFPGAFVSSSLQYSEAAMASRAAKEPEDA